MESDLHFCEIDQLPAKKGKKQPKDSALNPDEIKRLIGEMRNQKDEDGCTLGELARESAEDMKEESAAGVLVNTALAMNFRWTAAAKRLDRFYSEYPNIKTFADLNKLMASMDEIEFCQKVFDIAAQQGKPRYQRLKQLIDGFLEFKKQSHLQDDWATIQKWGEQVDVDNIVDDLIVKGRPGIGLATVQNIKIVSGFNTSKPDRRIVQVLEQQFKMNLGKTGEKLPNAVHRVEELSKLTGYKCIELDQLFWYWLDIRMKERK